MAATFFFAGSAGSKAERMSQIHTGIHRDRTWSVTQAALAKGCLQWHFHTGLAQNIDKRPFCLWLVETKIQQ